MREDKKIRLSGIIFESLTNGTGIRRVFFSQGCKHGCKGCFNPSTHSFTGGQEHNMDELLRDLNENPFIAGVTFSGGDPFEQATKFSYMAKRIKEMGLSIWCYTGYTFEQILEHMKVREGWKDMIENIDVLIDGKFEIDKNDDSLRFRGSSNQRIIDVQESLKTGAVVERKVV